jgi:DNA-binding SARP family transcriptional activator
MFEFRVLGPLEALRDGEVLDVRGAKRRALLALLVLHANEVVRRERLIDELWGEAPPSTATASLHNQISRLRRELGAETLVTRPSGYVLRVDPSAVDLHRFQTLVAEAQPLPAKERSEKLRAALAMWRGSPLTDLGGDEALARDIERLEDMRANVIEQRIEADLELGHDGDLVPELEELVTKYPLRERLRAQLILALYRSGRQVEALETYRETRRMLVEELGIEPSPELRELERAILRQDPSLSRGEGSEGEAPPDGPPEGQRRRRVLPLVALVAVLGAAGAVAAVLVAHSGGANDSAARAAQRGTTRTSANIAVTTTASTASSTTNGTGARTSGSTRATTTSDHAQQSTTARAGKPTVETSRSTGPRERPSGARHHGKPAVPPIGGATTTSTSARKRNKPVHAAGPRVFLLADGFSAAAFNSALWDRGEAGTGVDFVQDDRLEVSVAANATPGGQVNLIEGQYRTNCGLTGNFDARVNYQTLTWPQDNGISIVLGADYPGDFIVAARASLDWGEGYWSNFGSWPRIQADDASGSLRLVRTAGMITSYYSRRGRWVKLESRETPRAPAHIVLQLASYSPAKYNGPVVAAFDRFRATAQYVDCPPGVPVPPRVSK